MAVSIPSSSSSTSDVPETSDGIIFFLDKLKQATPAEIARKQKVKANRPPVGKWHCKGIPQSIIRYNLEQWGIA